MEDLFERVYRYASEDKDDGWGYDWLPQTYQETEYGGVVQPKNKIEDRRVFVYEYIYKKHGQTPSDSEAAELLQGKREIAERICTLNKEKTEYIYRTDYCAVKEILSGSEHVGYDFVVRQRPFITLAEYLKQPSASARMGQILNGSDEEAEKQRHAFVTKLLQHLILGLKDIYRVKGVHGHINMDNIWLDEKEQQKEEFRLSPPGFTQFLRSEVVDRESIDEYAAPELCLDPDHPFDLQSDLYSIGMVIYFFLNGGNAPFASPAITAAEEHKRRRSGDTEIPAPKYGTSVLKYIVRKLLAFELDVRYSDFDEILADLRKMDNKVVDYNPMSVMTMSHDRENAIKRTKEDNRALAEKRKLELEGILKDLKDDESELRQELDVCRKNARKRRIEEQLARIEEGRSAIREDIGKAQAVIDNPPVVAVTTLSAKKKDDYVPPMDVKDLPDEEDPTEEGEVTEAPVPETGAVQPEQPANDQPPVMQPEPPVPEPEVPTDTGKGDDAIGVAIKEANKERKGAIWWVIVGILAVAAVVLTLVILGMLRNNQNSAGLCYDTDADAIICEEEIL